MVAGYMFGHAVNDFEAYRLLAVCNYEDTHCGAYNSIDGLETITSLQTGEVFYSVKDFVFSVIGMHSTDEWLECIFFVEPSFSDDETPVLLERGGWFPLRFCLED